MRDLVKREAVLALAKDVTLKGGAKHRCIDATKIYEIPSEEPERMTGKWIPGKETGRSMIGDAVIAIYYDHFTCSSCGRVYNTEEKPTWRHCPNCGSYNGGDE